MKWVLLRHAIEWYCLRLRFHLFESKWTHTTCVRFNINVATAKLYKPRTNLCRFLTKKPKPKLPSFLSIENLKLLSLKPLLQLIHIKCTTPNMITSHKVFIKNLHVYRFRCLCDHKSKLLVLPIRVKARLTVNLRFVFGVPVFENDVGVHLAPEFSVASEVAFVQSYYEVSFYHY